MVEVTWWPFHTVPCVVVTSNHRIILLFLSACCTDRRSWCGSPALSSVEAGMAMHICNPSAESSSSWSFACQLHGQIAELQVQWRRLSYKLGSDNWGRQPMSTFDIYMRWTWGFQKPTLFPVSLLSVPSAILQHHAFPLPCTLPWWSWAHSQTL